jgi:hypothetical protein
MIVKKVSGSEWDLPGGNRMSGTRQLEHQNWVSADKVRVSFDIHHDGSSILLKYYVHEKQVRGVHTGYNSAVWEDSCVEFFISPEMDVNYYNFEFNAIGTILGAYGMNRHQRTSLPVEVLKEIETVPSLGRDPIEKTGEPVSWTLAVRIPAGVLANSRVAGLSGLKATGNFYKCGDLLDEPHFLSWKPVLTDRPDFHSPQFFGNLEFE